MLLLFCLGLPSVLASQLITGPGGSGKTIKLKMNYHGLSMPLSYLARHQAKVSPENGMLVEDEMEKLYEVPEPRLPSSALAQPFVQKFATGPLAAVAGTNFEGPGTGLAGFVMTGAPPDTTLAVGPNHIVAWVNSQFVIYNKSGTVLTGPVNGNTLFTGVGNECATTNRGDPILQYDKLADRWILSQFAFGLSGGSPAAPYYQCFAVSTTGDPTGTYVRYSVSFSATAPSGLNDYGKLGVWPDGYYSSYNMFQGSPAGSNSGSALCVSDRVKMLAGDPTATTLCAPITFYGGGASLLPVDLDGTTLPSDLTQGGIFLRQSTAPALRYVKLKPNFVAGTVTVGDGFGGNSTTFINLALPTTLRACNGAAGSCIVQPGAGTSLLDTLADRVMYRLSFRNRGGVESMMLTQSVDPDGAGARGSALRWYEIRNPLGNPADADPNKRPVIYQNGTFDPGSTGDRWMGSIAMDRYGNMLAGYSLANSATSLKPSIAIAGREAGDALNTLQSEILAVTGTGSQNGGLTRWGDYSTMQVDPSDDRTFWYIAEYLSADGSFNWRTRIVSYGFIMPPDAPTIGTATGGNGSATVAFTAPGNNGGSTVTSYTATSSPGGFTSSGCTASPCSVTGLTNGTSYTFTVTATNAKGTSVASAASNSVTPTNPVSISIADATTGEGNSGTKLLTFTVSLSAPAVSPVTFDATTSDGTAAAPGDYTAAVFSGISIGVGQSSTTVSVTLKGDATLEPNETFNVTLSNVTGANVADGTAVGTILNDDKSRLTINDVSVTEGDTGTKTVSFNINLNAAAATNVTLDLATVDGTATAGSDYVAQNVTGFTIPAGKVSLPFVVTIKNDLLNEGNEAFRLVASNVVGASVFDGDSTATIVDNDNVPPTLKINDVSTTEGDTGTKTMTFTVTMSKALATDATFDLATADVTATAGSDYVALSLPGQVIPSGSLTKTFMVTVKNDLITESNETFQVNLSNAVGATIADGQGIGTIVDNDNVVPTLTIADVSTTEGDTGTKTMTFKATLSKAIGTDVTFNVATADVTATAGSDYVGLNLVGQVIPSGSLSANIVVTVNNDLFNEGDETFQVNLANVVGATLTDGQAIGTIVDNDTVDPTISFADVSMTEGNSGVKSMTFRIVLSKATINTVTVDIATADGTATAGSDYTALSLPGFVIDSGLTSKSFTVKVTSDTTAEPDETFLVNLSNAAGATFGDNQAVGTIKNDD